MSIDPIFVITGGTSGLGLELVRRLARDPAATILVGARNPEGATALATVAPGRVVIMPLDLIDPASVRSFAMAVLDWLGPERRIAGIGCIAGLQITKPQPLGAGDIEPTFAANHLGHFVLVHELLARLAPRAPVVTIGSGTHDPDDKLARRFGFRGALFPNADAVAHGQLDPGASPMQQGLDRYATSKFCNILFTYDMARRVPADVARFITFDPGLMPGTGLARDRSAVERFGWRYLMPVLRLLVDGVSTSSGSAAALADILGGKASGVETGSHVDFRLKRTPTSPDSVRPELGADLYRVSAALTGIRALDARPLTEPLRG